MVNEVSQKHSREELLRRAFLRIAYNVHHMWEETGCSDTRLFIEPLIPTKFVVVGQARSGGTHNEHVVPRVMICDQCHVMYDNGESVEAVATFIQKFLKVVLISKDEQDHLDKACNLNLRQRMPEGWTFDNGYVFERLKVGGIAFDLYPE
jgi:hypothetical protein